MSRIYDPVARIAPKKSIKFTQICMSIQVFGFETRLPTTRILTRLHVSSLPRMLSDETLSSGPEECFNTTQLNRKRLD